MSGNLAQHFKGGEGAVEVGAVVGGRHLGADASLALRHYWVGEADDVDAFSQKGVGKVACFFGVADHDGDDGVGAWDKLVAQFF